VDFHSPQYLTNLNAVEATPVKEPVKIGKFIKHSGIISS